MQDAEIKIRIAVEADADQLLNIYAYYIEHSAITFEYTVPTVEEFADRIRCIIKNYPYLVAEKQGVIAGYAYAGKFKDRPAYDWAVETTVYVHQDYKKSGVGKLLYNALEHILAAQNILNLNACIACSEREDEYLTNNSIQFHEHLGYEVVGEFHQCGYKFGRWYNMVWMEKLIGSHLEKPPMIKRFEEVRESIKEWI